MIFLKHPSPQGPILLPKILQHFLSHLQNTVQTSFNIKMIIWPDSYISLLLSSSINLAGQSRWNLFTSPITYANVVSDYWKTLHIFFHPELFQVLPSRFPSSNPPPTHAAIPDNIRPRKAYLGTLSSLFSYQSIHAPLILLFFKNTFLLSPQNMPFWHITLKSLENQQVQGHSDSPLTPECKKEIFHMKGTLPILGG